MPNDARRLEWTPLAQADLLAIVDHISDDNPDAAQRLKNVIETKVERLREFPGLFHAGRVQGTREMVAHANYLIVYSEDQFTVRIVRVLRAARQWPTADCPPKNGVRDMAPPLYQTV